MLWDKLSYKKKHYNPKESQILLKQDLNSWTWTQGPWSNGLLCHGAACYSCRHFHTYIMRKGCVDLLYQFAQAIRVSCEVIEEKSEGGAGGLIASQDKNEGLGKNLVICQA